jgi:hypothetical protein
LSKIDADLPENIHKLRKVSEVMTFMDQTKFIKLVEQRSEFRDRHRLFDGTEIVAFSRLWSPAAGR